MVAVIRGILTLLLVVSNTLLLGMPFFIFVILKLLTPIKKWRLFCSNQLVNISELWIDINTLILSQTQTIQWDIRLPENLSKEEYYLVISNHQSWADIPIIQKVFNHKIPLLRFFLKKELIWIPILGMAWWALDFPFMQRYSKKYLSLHPEKNGKDLATTKKACKKFKEFPVTVMNFLEGTRFNSEKNSQTGDFKNLLNPKAGGAAFALEAMNGKITTILDITLIYHNTTHDLWDIMCGRVRKISVSAKRIDIPPQFLNGNYQTNATYKVAFQTWINQIWREKDELIEKIHLNNH